MLTGKVAAVTGAGRGIGKAVAHRLARLGAHVVALGRDEEALRAAAHGFGDMSVHVCDVTDAAGVAAVFGSLDRVDILVNNAGTASSNPVARVTLDEWEHHLAVNATGVFLCTQAVLAGMRERGWGRIVTIASTAAHVGTPYIAAYAASKHAALGFTRVVAAEVAGSGVTANAVCPGYVDTDMTERTIATIVAKTGMSAGEATERITAGSRQGRLLEPEEVAGAVAFLCSDEAAAINGQSIVIDGGGIQR
jgi:NAD(P)-dependent dehydrogenase (short-subunit alcohol dehydrogenase family)